MTAPPGKYAKKSLGKLTFPGIYTKMAVTQALCPWGREHFNFTFLSPRDIVEVGVPDDLQIQ